MITILPYTTKEPLQMIGLCAGICWNSSIDNKDKNIQRALDCIDSGHTRVAEFPDVYCIIDGYSARCIRELYTHIIGVTRLQSSTRYVYEGDLNCYEPDTISKSTDIKKTYENLVDRIGDFYKEMVDAGIPKEDAANILPLGMETKIVWKINLRALIHFMNMRLCSRAYKEIRALAKELKIELHNYSYEWGIIEDKYLVPKCIADGICKEKKTCKTQ